MVRDYLYITLGNRLKRSSPTRPTPSEPRRHQNLQLLCQGQTIRRLLR